MECEAAAAAAGAGCTAGLAFLLCFNPYILFFACVQIVSPVLAHVLYFYL